MFRLSRPRRRRRRSVMIFRYERVSARSVGPSIRRPVRLTFAAVRPILNLHNNNWCDGKKNKKSEKKRRRRQRALRTSKRPMVRLKCGVRLLFYTRVITLDQI